MEYSGIATPVTVSDSAETNHHHVEVSPMLGVIFQEPDQGPVVKLPDVEPEPHAGESIAQYVNLPTVDVNQLNHVLTGRRTDAE